MTHSGPTSSDNKPSTTLPVTGVSPVDQQFQVFAVLWSIASLFHVWNQFHWPCSSTKLAIDFTTVLVGLAVVARPRSLGTFFVFVLFHVVHGIYELPHVPNHRLLTLLVDATVLLSYASVGLRRDEPLTRETLFQSFSSSVRLLFVICYGFAAIAKYNWGFLDVQLSCAAVQYRTIVAQWLPYFPKGDGACYLAIGGTLLVESAVALGLLTRRFRHSAVILGTLFHYFLSVTPIVSFPDFSAMLFALLFLFTPPEFAGRLGLWSDRSTAAPPRLTWILALACTMVFVAAALLAFSTPSGGTETPFTWLRFSSFVVFSFLWCMLLVRGGLSQLSSTLARPFQLRAVAHAFTLAAVLLSAASPYIGLKTVTAFTMFSNLRTEGKQSNHLFLPQIYLTSFQNDLVEIMDSSNPQLRELSETGMLLTWFEFADIVRNNRDDWVRYQRSGKVREIDGSGSGSELMAPPWWQRQLLLFRAVPKDGSCPCQW